VKTGNERQGTGRVHRSVRKTGCRLGSASYWGKPPEELRRSNEIGDAILLHWLELFEKRGNDQGK